MTGGGLRFEEHEMNAQSEKYFDLLPSFVLSRPTARTFVEILCFLSWLVHQVVRSPAMIALITGAVTMDEDVRDAARTTRAGLWLG